jgi:predicted small secreted protein
MDDPHGHESRIGGRPVLLAAPALTALIVLLATLFAACGGVEGTYSMTRGEDVMQSFTLTLEGDEFTLAGPNPVGGPDIEFKGEYTVDGDKISLHMAGDESEVGSVEGDDLVFDTVTWTRQ